MAKDLSLSEPYPQDQSAMIQYLMSINPELASEIGPMMSPLTQGMLAGFAPRASNVGTTAATNYAQDVASIGFDDAFAAYGGPGAYAEGAFDPVTTTNVVETPGRRRLLQARQQGTSVDSIIARVLMDGGAPGDAYAEVSKLVQDAVTAGTNATPDQQNLLNQLPRNPDPAVAPGTLQAFDLNFVNDLARDMNDLAMSDPPEGTFSPVVGPDGTIIKPGGERRWITDDNGNEVLVEYSSQPSEVAQQYIDQGLSLPTDEYTAEGLLGQQWQDQAAALSGSRDVQNAASRAMRTNRQDPTLAARQSEMNEIPYSGPTNNAMPATAPGGFTGTPQRTLADVGVVQPEQDVSDIVGQINAESNRFGYPGMYGQDLQSLIAAAAAQGNDVTDIINPANANIGGATSAPAAAPQQAGVPSLDQLLAMMGQGQQQPQTTAPAGPNGDVSDILGTLNNGSNQATGYGQYGAQDPGIIQQLMQNSQMLGLPGGQQPPPPTPQYNTPGQAPVDPNASGPPPPQSGGVLGIGDYLNQYVMGGGTQPHAGAPQQAPYQGPGDPPPPTTTTAPGLVTQMGPIPGSPDWLAMQSQGFQGWPTATDALSYQNNQRHMNYPDQPEYNALSGGSANAGSLPQGGGVLGIGDYLNQYVMGGGTQPHAGAPPQPGYNPLPGNQPSGNASMRTGAEPSEAAPQGPGLNYADLAQLFGLTNNTSSRTGPEPSEGAPRRGSSSRTGPEPSEGAPRGGASPAPSGGAGALWQQMWQQAQQPTYNPLSGGSANAGSRDNGTPSTGRSSAPQDLLDYNQGVGERADKARRRAGGATNNRLGFRQEDVDNWLASVQQGNAERSHYGAEYGRAAGLAYLMRRSGIRPLDRELATRGAVASGMGLRPS